MINILLKTVLSNIELDYGYNSIILNNKELYRKTYYTPLEEMIISTNSEEISTSKINIIKNILDFDINEKKNITELYKYMDKNVTSNFTEEKYDLYSQITSFLDLVLDNDINNLEYNIDIDFSKFLQSVDLKYKLSDNFIENIVNYITYVSKKSVLVITYSLNTYLEQNEIETLNSELSKRQISLVDISSNVTNQFTKLIIDKDLCII